MFSYVFEARSIQPWILAGGRLADMVAASDIVDQLCGRMIDSAFEALGLEEDRELRLARRAGGALYAVSADRVRLEALRDLISLLAPAFAPGLEFIHAMSEGTTEREALRSALERLQTMRNRPAVRLPQAGPLVEREARTGDPAIAFVRGGAPRKRGAIGAATQAKRAAGQVVDTLSRRFIPQQAQGGANWVWPLDMEPEEGDEADSHTFPFLGEARVIGVVHADGNGLGQILLKLQEAVANAPGVDYVAVFRDFSDRVERATVRAACEASEEILMPAAFALTERSGRRVRKLPARPLVLGGDDLSIIVRADLAVPYTRAFLVAFERTTREELAAWRADRRWCALFEGEGPGRELAALDRMSACAGIAFVRASQPFDLAYELAEALCKRAKAASTQVQPPVGPKPASLAFYRLTNSLAPGKEAAQIALPGSAEGKVSAHLRMPAWGLDEAGRLPSLQALEALAGLVAGTTDLAPGVLRHLLTVMQDDPGGAPALYRRWRQVREPRALAAFDAALGRLGRTMPGLDLPVLAIGTDADGRPAHVCPLEDLFDLMAVAAEDRQAGEMKWTPPTP